MRASRPLGAKGRRPRMGNGGSPPRCPDSPLSLSLSLLSLPLVGSNPTSRIRDSRCLEWSISQARSKSKCTRRSGEHQSKGLMSERGAGQATALVHRGRLHKWLERQKFRDRVNMNYIVLPLIGRLQGGARWHCCSVKLVTRIQQSSEKSLHGSVHKTINKMHMV